MEDSGICVQGVAFKDERTGLRDVSLCVGGPDVAQVCAAIEQAFEATVTKHLAEADFSGAIEVAVLGELTPATPELRQTLSKLEAVLRARARDLITISGRQLTVGVVYTSNDDKL